MSPNRTCSRVHLDHRKNSQIPTKNNVRIGNSGTVSWLQRPRKCLFNYPRDGHPIHPATKKALRATKYVYVVSGDSGRLVARRNLHNFHKSEWVWKPPQSLWWMAVIMVKALVTSNCVTYARESALRKLINGRRLCFHANSKSMTVPFGGINIFMIFTITSLSQPAQSVELMYSYHFLPFTKLF